MFTIRRSTSSLAFVFSLLITSAAASAVELDSTHIAVPGDFNADGRLDVLLQPLTDADKGAIVLQDGTGNLSIVAQGWDPNYLGLDWSAGSSTLTTADLNGDGQDDVIIQPLKSGGNAAVLITDPSIQFLAVHQLLPKGYLGMDWSAAANSIVAGDFDGDHRKELFLQSVKRAGIGALVHTDAAGQLVAVYQSFPDRYLGRHWDGADENFYVGDFNGDGRQDLLVQSKGRAGESAYALLLADGNGRFTRLNETWNLKDLGADWDPATHAIVIEDANGDGIMDITLRSKTGGTNYLFEGDAQGRFGQPAIHWTGDKTASEALAANNKNKPRTKTGISVGTTGLTANLLTGPTDPETDPVIQRPGALGSQGSGQIMTVNTVGALPGQPGVSGGAATYSIPISMPPGIHGMQPSVSLNYSSRGGNGEMGMGWSLGAGSQIHRCPATEAMDGYSTGVNYSSTDRLCLDGQHLVLVSGTYGSASAVYRTELDSFVRVTQLGAGIGSTNSYFKVERRDNHVLYYGNTADSVFVAGSETAPLAWGLNQEADQHGNSIDYVYGVFGVGEYLLKDIFYTGDSNNFGTRHVAFIYNSRADISEQNLGGGVTTQTQLLTQVNVASGIGSVARSYTLEYGTSAATGRSLLKGVQECGPTASGQVCQGETTFSWHSPATSLNYPVSLSAGLDQESGTGFGEPNQPTLSMMGDFNGDGRKELYYYRPATLNSPLINRIYFLNSSGTAVGQFDIPSTGTTKLFTDVLPDTAADLDGDGDAELLGAVDGCGGAGCLAYAKFTGTAASPNFSTAHATTIPYTMAESNGYTIGAILGVTDIDGDGRPDVVYRTDTNGNINILVRLNTTAPGSGNVTFGAPISVYSSSENSGFGITLGADMDGNGHPDFTISGGEQLLGFIFTNEDANGNLSFSQPYLVSDLGVTGNAVDTRNFHIQADINGDGLPDMVFDCYGSADWCYQLNTGKVGSKMFADTVDTQVLDVTYSGNPDIAFAQAGLFSADIDNDGKDELLYPDESRMIAEYCVTMQHVTTKDGPDQTANECVLDGDDGLTLKPSDDHSIYYYNKIEFLPQPDASQTGGYRYVPQSHTTDIIAQSHFATAVDLQGDGLTGILSPFTKWYDFGNFKLEPGYSTRPVGPSLAVNAQASADSGNAAPDLMLSSNDALGFTARWNYYPLSTGKTYNGISLYSTPSANVGAYADPGYFYFASSMYVVGDFTVDNGVGHTHTHDFHYGQAIYNGQGRGFQGFRTVVDDDMGSGARTVQVYHQHFPLSGLLDSSWTTAQTSANGTYQFNLNAPNANGDTSVVDQSTDTWGCMQQTTATMVTVDGVTCEPVLGANTYAPVLLASTEDKFDPATHRKLSHTDARYCPAGGACTATAGYDRYANNQGSVTTVTDAAGTYTASVSNLFDLSSASSWWIAKLSSTTSTVDAVYNTDTGGTADRGSVTRVSTIGANYDAYRAPTSVTDTITGQDALVRTTATTYDARGNVATVTVSGGTSTDGTLLPPRTSTTHYPASGSDAYYFPDYVQNAANQVTHLQSDARFGTPTVVTDPNGVETDTAYDPFGRKTSVQVVAPVSIPAQTYLYVPHTDGDGMCDGTTASSQYYVLLNQVGYPSQYACYDMLNRVVRSAAESFSTQGLHVYTDTAYDSLGRAKQVSEPHFSDDTSFAWNINNYDDSNIAGRLSSHVDAKGVTTAYTYNQTAGSTYDPLTTHITTTAPGVPERDDEELKNSLGKMLSVTNAIGATDAQGNSITTVTSYAYDSDGNPIKVIAADGSEIDAIYNGLGQKTQVTDPDQGQTNYLYDVAGDLVKQTDAKNQVTRMDYDVLGRMTDKQAPEGVTNWCYDGQVFSVASGSCTGSSTVAGAIGKPTSVWQYDGYQQTYSYDAAGRPSRVEDLIGGTAYDTDTSYDADGRVDTVTYPYSVADQAPVASVGALQYAAPHTSVSLSGTASDPDNAPDPLMYQWRQTTGPVVTLSGKTTTMPTFTTTGTVGTTYRFLFKADDGLFAGTATATVVIPGAPAAPSSLSDTNDDGNHTGDTTANDGIYVVNWPAVSVTGATVKYHVEEAGTDTSAAPAASAYTEVAVVGTNSYTASHPGNSHYYYWYRVRAEDFVGSNSVALGNYSPVDSIHLVVTPGMPSSISPTTATNTTGTYTISWGTYTGSVVSSKVFYELQEDSNSGFTSAATIYSGANRSKSITKTGLGEWYYRVRACNQDGTVKHCSGWRARADIMVEGTTGNCDIGVNCKVQFQWDGGRYGAVQSTQGPRVTASPVLLEVTDIPSERIAAVQAPAAPGHGVRPVFAPPVYQAYAGAHLQLATTTVQFARLSVKYLYSGNGYLSALVNGIDSNRIFWQVDSSMGAAIDAGGNHIQYGMDARGNVTDSLYGGTIGSHYGYDPNSSFLESINTGANGQYQNETYAWSPLGNLTQRTGVVSSSNLSELFDYDAHNRLTKSTVTNASGPHVVTYAYGLTGNLTCRSDVVGHDCSVDPTGYSYGQGGAFPHAITAINGVAITASYAYDADGNMACRAQDNSCAGFDPTSQGNLIWNSDNLPTGISKDGSDFSDFTYAPDKHRYTQESISGGATTNYIYVGNFEVKNVGNNTEFRHYLKAYGRQVAIDKLWTDNTDPNNPVPAETMTYTLTDHLGSVDSELTVDATTGAISASLYSYDTFGGNRNPADWMTPSSSGPHHGYTDHESLDNVQLIHMDGRVYDPQAGRFLSVDPVFQAPTNGQSINPYSYVMNNPLSLTDPSGYQACNTQAPTSDGQGTTTVTCNATASSDGSNLKPGQTAQATVHVETSTLGSHINNSETITATVTAGNSPCGTNSGDGNGNSQTSQAGTTGGSTSSLGNGAPVKQQGSQAQSDNQSTEQGSKTTKVSQNSEQQQVGAPKVVTTPSKQFDIDLLAPGDPAYAPSLTYVRTPETANDFIVIGHGNEPWGTLVTDETDHNKDLNDAALTAKIIGSKEFRDNPRFVMLMICMSGRNLSALASKVSQDLWNAGYHVPVSGPISYGNIGKGVYSAAPGRQRTFLDGHEILDGPKRPEQPESP